METPRRKDFSDLIEDLKKNASMYNVWQAVFLGEVITRSLNPDRKEYLLDQKGLKFRPYEHYVYPPTDLRSVDFDENKTLTYILNFLGLYGINSPVPRCYHEFVAMQQNIFGKGEVPLQNFLDIFNDRFYWLYYLSWKKYKYHLYFHEGPTNKVIQRINSFIGRGPDYSNQTSSISNLTLLKYSGILSNRIRNRSGLIIILNYLFPNIKFKVLEFVPRWTKFSNRVSLSTSDDQDGFALGKNSYIGESKLDRMSRISLQIGPISYSKYLDFIPGTKKALMLNEFLKLYLNDGLEYNVEIKIESETISAMDWTDHRHRLGYTVWLGKPKTSFEDIHFSYEEYTTSN